jgi:hypothetical protein
MAIGKSKLHKLLQNGKKLNSATTWYNTFSVELKEQILKWIQDDQLKAKGVNKDGEVIGYYSLTTSFINPKKTFNSHYTFYDTGEFFRSMFVRVFPDRITINADAQKGEDNLFEKYGTEIIGLTDENLEKLKAKILEHYQKELKRILFQY